MEDSQHKNVLVGKLVANFVVPDKDAPYLARCKLGKACAQARVRRESLRAGHEVSDLTRGCGCIDCKQKLVQANKIRVRLARPAQRHL